MMIKEYFIKQSIKEAQIEEFIKKKFPLGDYSKTEIQRTPLGIKILIYTNKPGRIIGRGGKNINEITDALKARFSLENPQVDVKSIINPDLDAKIVAKQIASALEKGYNYKKIGNLTMKRILDAGAAGAEIVIKGKLGGSKGMMGKFVEGYMKHCGQPSKEMVDHGFEEAQTRGGKIGISVKIMNEFLDITGQKRKIRESKKEEEPKYLVDVLKEEKDVEVVEVFETEESKDTKKEPVKEVKRKRPVKKGAPKRMPKKKV